MSNDGGPAFPQIESEYSPVSHEYTGNVYSSGGITIRDWFAGQALQYVLSMTTSYAAVSGGGTQMHVSTKGAATLAYEVADAMLNARESC